MKLSTCPLIRSSKMVTTISALLGSLLALSVIVSPLSSVSRYAKGSHGHSKSTKA